MIRVRPLVWRLVACSVAISSTNALAVDIQRYSIQPGGRYTYKPSQFIGIPGCDPSQYECGFGVAGSFSIEFDRDADTAKLFDLDLLLTGNEDIQANPPNFAAVTPDRVADYLAARLFRLLPIGSIQYADETHQALRLTDSLAGEVFLHGGFDGTPVDGIGMLFNFHAAAVPEPSPVAVGCGLVLVGLFARMRDSGNSNVRRLALEQRAMP